MTDTLLELAYDLSKAAEPFVLATVVWCERPTSAKPGAHALIQADCTITGWIGGSCAQPVVIREAQRMLREGDGPYLLRLGTSETAVERDNMRVFPMSCASGGVLDIYMEPHVPLPQLVLIGDSPVLSALKSLAEVVGEEHVVPYRYPVRRRWRSSWETRAYCRAPLPFLKSPGAADMGRRPRATCAAPRESQQAARNSRLSSP